VGDEKVLSCEGCANARETCELGHERWRAVEWKRAASVAGGDVSMWWCAV